MSDPNGTYHESYESMLNRALSNFSLFVVVNETTLSLYGHRSYSISREQALAFITPIIYHNTFHNPEWEGCWQEERDELLLIFTGDLEDHLSNKLHRVGINH